MKIRLDLLLVEKNYFDSRQKAQAAIMAGIVKIGDKIFDKPGTMVNLDAQIILTKSVEDDYVSRGGLKLEKAVKEFQPVIKDKVFLDIGASTGGFTDCLLRNNAKFVYAIDVGYGQIDWALRQDQRVKVIERCNARYLTFEELYKSDSLIAEGAVIDVSFISLEKIIPNIIKLLKPEFYIIALVKPQFEAGKEKVNKGVVESPEIHSDVLLRFKNFLEKENLFFANLTYSAIKGPSGNIEFLAHITQKEPPEKVSSGDIQKIIKDAHSFL